jgi:hypothetical protein
MVEGLSRSGNDDIDPLTVRFSAIVHRKPLARTLILR